MQIDGIVDDSDSRVTVNGGIVLTEEVRAADPNDIDETKAFPQLLFERGFSDGSVDYLHAEAVEFGRIGLSHQATVRKECHVAVQ
jgi:hypothetical protein